ncbi:DUF6265 family protein [Bowmanella pacifica]|uniref:DUF6265 domain-containing protein n=1 Tax=Bowmanella pacifica TaxID=502051 RepID=A0A917Z307_9ALTE|nr:DUF6265 family protein [Bowmanella pacifica]GGO73719.1 hypothetical protein GCM10010982_34900 [Bowmanella pacifica]
MRNTNSVLLLVIFLLPSFATFADCNDLSALHWLLGQWQQQGDDKNYQENWYQVSPHSFEGTAGSGSQNAAQREALRIVNMQGKLFYLAKVSENPLPIAFLLQHCHAGEAIFVNAGHDFPQRLHYKRVQDKLIIRVESLQGKGFSLQLHKK